MYGVYVLLGEEGNEESRSLVISVDLFYKLSESISSQDLESVKGILLQRFLRNPALLMQLPFVAFVNLSVPRCLWLVDWGSLQLLVVAEEALWD